MILITGASGQTGTRLVKLLRARGEAVRGLARSAASASHLAALGAEPVEGDMRDATVLRAALRGVECVYHIAPSLAADEEALHRTVIDAAKAAGVRHFVLHGAIAPFLEDVNFHWAKLKAALFLFQSGMPYTVLIPTNYMQNVTWSWPLIAERGRWELPYRTDVKLSWVDVDDIAEAAANVLTGSGDEYATYELAGTDSVLTRAEIAVLMSEALGKKVEAVRVDVDEYLARAASMPFFARATPQELDQIRGMFAHYDAVGCPAGNGKTLSMLLGRPANSYRQFVARLAAPAKS